MVSKVAVVGAGSWGTTVATLAARNCPTVLWARRADLAEEVNGQHTNRQYLLGYALPKQLVATASLEEAVTGAEVVVMGVPSHGFRDVLGEARAHITPGIPVISLTKGV